MENVFWWFIKREFSPTLPLWEKVRKDRTMESLIRFVIALKRKNPDDTEVEITSKYGQLIIRVASWTARESATTYFDNYPSTAFHLLW